MTLYRRPFLHENTEVNLMKVAKPCSGITVHFVLWSGRKLTFPAVLIRCHDEDKTEW